MSKSVERRLAVQIPEKDRIKVIMRLQSRVKELENGIKAYFENRDFFDDVKAYAAEQALAELIKKD